MFPLLPKHASDKSIEISMNFFLGSQLPSIEQITPLNEKSRYEFQPDNHVTAMDDIYSVLRPSNSNSQSHTSASQMTETLESLSLDEEKPPLRPVCHEEGKVLCLSPMFHDCVLMNSLHLLQNCYGHARYKTMMKALSRDFKIPQAVELFIERLDFRTFLSVAAHYRGKHLIASLLVECSAEQLNKIVFNKIKNSPNSNGLLAFAKGRHTSMLMEKIFNLASPWLKLKLVNAFLSSLPTLSQSRYGNYLVTEMVKEMHRMRCDSMMTPLVEQANVLHHQICDLFLTMGSFFDLVDDKYSSYILELLIETCENSIRIHLVRQLLSITIHQQSLFRFLLRGKQSNYVMQKLVAVLEKRCAVSQRDLGLTSQLWNEFQHARSSAHLENRMII